jgi:ABC-type uncharacterized transport system auxiliary subunit
MLADWLIRDISQSRLFGSVVAPGEPFVSSYEMGGHLYEFGWKTQAETARAVLDVEVTLLGERQGRTQQIMLRKHYQLESPPVSENSPEAFARAMSELMRTFAEQLRGDLCLTARGDSSFPAGG